MATLASLLGKHRKATAAGWVNFCHKSCGDKRFRLGVHPRKGKFRCFNCGQHGTLDDLLDGRLKGLPLGLDTVRALPRPPAKGLPWRPLPASDSAGVLGDAALAYLARRGIPQAHAARLGLGVGVDGRWFGRVIFPYFGVDGRLAGWQGRLTRDPLPDEDIKKIIFAAKGEMPAGLTCRHPNDGMLYLIERVPVGSPVLLVEGPVDAIHGERACPAAAMFGSNFTEAQARRLLSRRPSAIYLGFDRDKSGPRWNDITNTWEPDPRPAVARMLYSRTLAPIYVVRYPDGFDGDWGGHADKTPHTTDDLTALLAGAVRWGPGVTL